MRHEIAEAGLSEEILVDSAGTAAYHVGNLSDARSRELAKSRGVVLESIARQFVASDFDRFDYVLAMDQDNFDDLHSLASSDEQVQKLFLFRSFDSTSEVGASVPDPYYGGAKGFDQVFSICEAASRGLLAYLRKTHL